MNNDNRTANAGNFVPGSEEERIYVALCELLTPFNKQNIALLPDTEISAELNIDSLAVMDFIMEVEDRFDIDIPLNVLAHTQSLADLTIVVKQSLAKAKP